MKNDNHMDCDAVELVLELWGDGELDQVRGEQVREHLLECPACRETYRDHRNLRRWIVRPEAPAVPADFAQRVVLAAARQDVVAGREPLEIPERGRGAVLRPFPARTSAGDPAGGGAVSSGGGFATSTDGSLLPFVLACTAAAAALLMILTIAIGSAGRPTSDELRADPLPSVLNDLQKLRERELLERGTNGAASTQRSTENRSNGGR
ncbi:hypothetical protein Pla163_35760 [Planctomycetes bacterium Pla163]|uniref:Putative zinc-finger domain-containing protein n=1 Tax=Rohdeia mirabilis TaxID=2528008 RepID=A0A518D4M1_9BACT|nr:hypothetical protein Pla163_35760 [Planctomycetes bacterium Pla163]